MMKRKIFPIIVFISFLVTNCNRYQLKKNRVKNKVPTTEMGFGNLLNSDENLSNLSSMIDNNFDYVSNAFNTIDQNWSKMKNFPSQLTDEVMDQVLEAYEKQQQNIDVIFGQIDKKVNLENKLLNERIEVEKRKIDYIGKNNGDLGKTLLYRMSKKDPNTGEEIFMEYVYGTSHIVSVKVGKGLTQVPGFVKEAVKQCNNLCMELSERLFDSNRLLLNCAIGRLISVLDRVKRLRTEESLNEGLAYLLGSNQSNQGLSNLHKWLLDETVEKREQYLYRFLRVLNMLKVIYDEMVHQEYYAPIGLHHMNSVLAERFEDILKGKIDCAVPDIQLGQFAKGLGKNILRGLDRKISSVEHDSMDIQYLSSDTNDFINSFGESIYF